MRLGVLAFAAGILTLQLQPAVPPAAGLIALAALSLFLLLVSRPSWLRRAALLAACFGLGFAWAGGVALWRLADALPSVWESRDLQLRGIVASLPQRFDRGERFELVVESVGTAGASVPSKIMLSWYHGWDDIDDTRAPGLSQAVRPGERWQFTVRLKRPHGHANPHGFDYEAWLFERGIRATGIIRTQGDNRRLDEFVWRPGTIVQRLRDEVRGRFVAALPEAPYLGVLTALAVGDQRAIPYAQWQVFNRTGVTHLVSISGLHVTMVAALCAALVSGLWRRSPALMLRLPAQKAAVLAGWGAALAYALLAGFEVPAQRTVCMLSAVAIMLLSGRHFTVGRTLALAMLAVLVADPWAVLSTGFWLSFGAVAVLLWIGSARIGEGVGVRAVLLRWGTAQWAVTVGSLPLLLFFFQQFSLVSPLANALAIPVVSFAITPLALLFVVMPWPPLLHFDHCLLEQLMRLLDALAGWPVWHQAAPPEWAVLVAALGVFWLLLPHGFPARWLGACLLLPALTAVPPRPPSGEAWVDILDVGQGLAVVVRTAGHALLYDTGPLYSAEANAGNRVVVPYLRAVGIRHLDAVLASHRDKDHTGGLPSVLEAIPVERLLSSLGDIGGERCSVGQQWLWDGVRFEVLYPGDEDYRQKAKRPNGLSCVLRVASAGGSVVLAGDLETTDERDLVRRVGERLHSTALVAPHHGGAGSSSSELIAAVAPREAVFSAGYRNAFRHPRPEVLARYAGSRIWRTDRDGAIRLRLGTESAASAWRTARPRYWSGG